jgi:hypothetical protein
MTKLANSTAALGTVCFLHVIFIDFRVGRDSLVAEEKHAGWYIKGFGPKENEPGLE